MESFQNEPDIVRKLSVCQIEYVGVKDGFDMYLCLQCTKLSASGENDEEFDIPKKK